MSIALLVVGLLVAGFAIAAVSAAPWVPAFKRDIEAVLDDSGLKAGELYIELGCGEGRLLKAAAKRGARVIGYEINPLLWLITWLRVLPYKNAQVRLRDFWGVDLSRADVVLAFLVPRTMPRLETKIKNHMKPGSRLVSYIFELPNTKATHARHHWYIYIF